MYNSFSAKHLATPHMPIGFLKNWTLWTKIKYKHKHTPVNSFVYAFVLAKFALPHAEYLLNFSWTKQTSILKNWLFETCMYIISSRRSDLVIWKIGLSAQAMIFKANALNTNLIIMYSCAVENGVHRCVHSWFWCICFFFHINHYHFPN